MWHILRRYLTVLCVRNQPELKVSALVSPLSVILTLSFKEFYHKPIIGWKFETIIDDAFIILGSLSTLASLAALLILRMLIISEMDEFDQTEGLGGFMAIPKDLQRKDYYFCMARDQSALQPFVDLSDAEAHIAKPKNLFGKKRRFLYEKWQRWSGNAFLVLYRHVRSTGSWEAASVSICLPLSQGGVEFLMGPDGDAVALEHEHIATDENDIAAILIDTWITKTGFQLRKNNVERKRVKTEKHANMLVLMHLGVYMHSKPYALIAEASNKSLRPILEKNGFVRSLEKNNKHFILTEEAIMSGSEKIDLIYNNIITLRRTSIKNFR